MSTAPAHARISVIMWSTAPFTKAAPQSLKSLFIFVVLIVGKFFHKNKKADRIICTSAATDLTKNYAVLPR